MTINKTITLAQDYARNGNIEGACRILQTAFRVAKSGRSQMRLDMARLAILDAAVDATAARSQVR